MIEEFAKDEECSIEEAIEFIDYNTLRAIPYATQLLGPDAVPPIVVGQSELFNSMKKE